jgi:lipopolysaccharide transport system permease protein
MQTRTEQLNFSFPPAEDVFEWAWDAMQKQEWEQAVHYWQIARDMMPHKAPTWIQAAIAHRHLGNFEQSETLLKTAIEEFPDNSNVLVQLAELYMAKEAWENALQVWEKVRKKFPDEMAGWIGPGDVYLAQKDCEQALNFNVKAREKFPDHPAPLIQQAEIAMAEEKWSEALEYWGKLRVQFPKEPAGYFRAAEAAKKLGDHQLAEKLLCTKREAEQQPMSEEETKHRFVPSKRSWSTLFDLIWVKAVLNLKSEANRNKLSYLWWIFEPFLYMLVFYIVFTKLLHRGGENYVVFLLTGLVMFQWFAKSVNSASNSILNAKKLLQQVSIEPFFFPAVAVLQTTLKQVPVFVILILFIWIYGFSPTIHWSGLIVIMLTQLGLILIVSIMLALIIPFFKDLQQIVPTIIQFMMFVSGVFFSVDRIPEQWRELFFLNPVANLLHQYRLVLMENSWPEWMMLSQTLLIVASLGIVCIGFYMKYKHSYAKAVME